jgi:hypothetical protein
MKCFSISKLEGEHSNRNQDFCAEKDGHFALSDGAGGYGFYASEWSEHLVKKALERTTPFETKEAFINWFNELRQPFYQEYERIAESESAANSQYTNWLEAYKEEGSAATFISVKRVSETEVEVLAFGDSLAIQLNATFSCLNRTISALYQFTQNPDLLCSNEALTTPERVYLERWEVSPTDTLLVSSDSLGQLILMLVLFLGKEKPDAAEELKKVKSSPYPLGNFLDEIEKIEDPASVLERLVALEDEAAFSAFCKEYLEAKMLQMDDYSLIVKD